MLDICDVYDLHSLISIPTRISSSKESCLDVILSNLLSLTLKSGTVDIGLSDHTLIYTIFNKKLLKPKARLIKGRCFEKFNDEEFNKDLHFVPFHAFYVFDNIDDTYWAWEELHKYVVDDHAPIKCRKVREGFRGSKIYHPRNT